MPGKGLSQSLLQRLMDVMLYYSSITPRHHPSCSLQPAPRDIGVYDLIKNLLSVALVRRSDPWHDRDCRVSNFIINVFRWVVLPVLLERNLATLVPRGGKPRKNRLPSPQLASKSIAVGSTIGPRVCQANQMLIDTH